MSNRRLESGEQWFSWHSSPQWNTNCNNWYEASLLLNVKWKIFSIENIILNTRHWPRHAEILWERSLIIVQQPVAPTETYFARFWLTWPNITLIIFNILLFQTLKIRQLLIRGASRFHHLKHTFYLTLDTKNIQQNTSVNNCKSNLERIMYVACSYIHK